MTQMAHRGSARDNKIERPQVERQCALTRDTLPTADLIRFAVGPDDIVVPDVDGKAPGRGVWIRLDHQSVDDAIAKNIFSRSLKHKVMAAPDLANLTTTRLEQRLTGALGLARKAGQLALGATKVKSALASGAVLALMTAKDGAPDGKRKILSAMRAAPNAGTVQHFELLTAEQMSLALGAENVIHAAVLNGPAGLSALKRASRLARYLGRDRADMDKTDQQDDDARRPEMNDLKTTD